MFALCDKKETKTDTPEMQRNPRSDVPAKIRREAKRYLENLRRQAMIEYKIPKTNSATRRDRSCSLWH